jgi:hypothetical protein
MFNSELDAFPLVQIMEALSLDGRVVNKDIFVSPSGV